MHKFRLFSVRLLPHHVQMIETMLLLVCSVLIFTSQAGAAVTRLTQRSVLVYDQSPGAVTKYEVAFTYNTTSDPIGSIDMLFCYNPIPTDPCNAPVGLDVSNAVLSSQTGETGFNIATRTSNHLVLTRAPSPVGNTPSTYTFSGIVNPTQYRSFAIRLSDYSTIDASGPEIDLGSVVTGINDSVTISAQVPPMMYFCVAQQVTDDCTQLNGGNYSDLGTLSSSNTLTATSQMAAGTNASGGYVITVNGPTMSAGTNVINSLTSPTLSAAGNSQFGINLVANNSPNIGADPDGTFINATAAPNYANPNRFTYNDGDVVASAPNVSLVRRYTVSYIVNVPPNLRAGVYTTTLTYVCTGRF
jgi:hypothetical protein